MDPDQTPRNAASDQVYIVCIKFRNFSKTVNIIQLFHACFRIDKTTVRGAVDSSMHFCPRSIFRLFIT